MSSLYEILTPDFIFQDDRGALAQLVHQGYEQINVLVTKAGVTRGGHYHRETREAFYVVSGSVELTFTRGEESEKKGFSAGEFFLIYPGVVHTMHFPEDCVMVAMYDICVEKENGEKDIYPA